jgi:hypothetical protein
MGGGGRKFGGDGGKKFGGSPGKKRPQGNQ